MIRTPSSTIRCSQTSIATTVDSLPETTATRGRMEADEPAMSEGRFCRGETCETAEGEAEAKREGIPPGGINITIRNSGAKAAAGSAANAKASSKAGGAQPAPAAGGQPNQPAAPAKRSRRGAKVGAQAIVNASYEPSIGNSKEEKKDEKKKKSGFWTDDKVWLNAKH